MAVAFFPVYFLVKFISQRKVMEAAVSPTTRIQVGNIKCSGRITSSSSAGGSDTGRHFWTSCSISPAWVLMTYVKYTEIFF